MSTFGGLMVEYPHIAIDRFQGPAVLRARAYFLSHAHADHMVGLDSKQFARRLRLSKHIKLYCSEVTHEFLLTDRRFVHLESFLIGLPIEEPTTVTLHDDTTGKKEQVLVTLLAAGHCPGSVMFLFEGDEGNVLYTGDFRFAKGEASRMLPLHSGARVKDIKSAYVDTTFCVPEAMFIPSREQSRDALLDLVEQQIQKSPSHMVRLACKAKYGYEYLFVELSKEFNLKVHVSPLVMAQYERVPDLAKHLTTEGSSTQVHACRYKDCSMPYATDVLVVVPSTMWFTSNARPSDVLRKVGNRYRLCFSFHSSFSEVRDFISYIRPVNVYPNVIPYGCTEEKIKERLQDLRRGANETALMEKFTYKPLGQLKVSARTSKRNITASGADGDSEDEFAELFGDSSSPPPVHRRKKVKIEGEDLDDGAQQQRISPEQENSNEHSYIAMDDSDLSSSELDLYDSPPGLGQSQPKESSSERPDETAFGSGDYVKSTGLDNAPHPATGSHATNNCPIKRTEFSKRVKEQGFDKQSRMDSKRNEINSWLRYLPDADSTPNQTHKVEGHHAQRHSPDEKRTGISRTEARGDVVSLGDTYRAEIKHADPSELINSQGDSDKTEYRFKNSQDSCAPEDDLQDTPREISGNSEKNQLRGHQLAGRSDYIEGHEAQELVKTDPNIEPHTTVSDPAEEQESTKNGNLISVGASDANAFHPHRDVLPTLQNQIQKNILLSESHATTVVVSSKHTTPESVVPVSHQGTTKRQATGDDNHNRQSQDTNQSQETFLPSSQGSIASRGSSDFDIPCTPDGKKPHPTEVEAVQVLLAKGESIPLASCKTTIKFD